MFTHFHLLLKINSLIDHLCEHACSLHDVHTITVPVYFKCITKSVENSVLFNSEQWFSRIEIILDFAMILWLRFRIKFTYLLLTYIQRCDNMNLPIVYYILLFVWHLANTQTFQRLVVQWHSLIWMSVKYNCKVNTKNKPKVNCNTAVYVKFNVQNVWTVSSVHWNGTILDNVTSITETL